VNNVTVAGLAELNIPAAWYRRIDDKAVVTLGIGSPVSNSASSSTSPLALSEYVITTPWAYAFAVKPKVSSIITHTSNILWRRLIFFISRDPLIALSKFDSIFEVELSQILVPFVELF
jgi:hypothetical protein